MRLLFLAGLTLLGSLTVRGQQQLMMYPTFGGAHFEYQKDTAYYQVTPKQVAQIMYDAPDAYKEFKKARTNSTISAIMGFVGAGLIIVPLATVVTEGDPEWALAAAGGALVIASVPFSASYRKRAQNAVDLYNKKHSALRPTTRFFVQGTGVRLVIRF